MKDWKNIVNRILFWQPPLLLIGIGGTVALFLLLAPLIRLALYAVPCGDDFSYAGFAQRMMAEEPGIAGAIKGAWECAKVQWYAWQGTFSSIFLMALSPHLWGEKYYCIGSIFLILILTVSVFLLMGTLAKEVLHVKFSSSLGVQVVAAIMVIELIYASPYAYYWYNSGIHYIGMHSFAMLFLIVLIHLFKAERIKSIKGVLLIAAGMLGALLVGGSNFVTGLQGIVMLGLMMGLALLSDRKKIWRYVPIAAVYLRTLYICISAPGNQVRGRFYEGWGYSAGEAVIRSFLEAFLHLWKFTGWMTFAVLILLVPIIWQMVGKSRFSFRLPGIILFGSICLYATGFTPGLYSLGHAGLSRTLNVVRITFQILLIVNEVYWLGWLRLKLENKGKHIGEKGAPWWFYGGVMAAVMLFIVNSSKNPIGDFSSWGAYYYIHTGEAYNFYEQYQERLTLLYSDEPDIVFEPYRYKPWMLCVGEVSTDPNGEINRAMTSWYGKNSIVLKEEPQEE